MKCLVLYIFIYEMQLLMCCSDNQQTLRCAAQLVQPSWHLLLPGSIHIQHVRLELCHLLRQHNTRCWGAFAIGSCVHIESAVHAYAVPIGLKVG